MFLAADDRIWPARTARANALAPDALDKFVFLPAMLFVCSAGLSLRLIGPLFIIEPIGLCLVYAVLRQESPPKLLSCYLAFCILIAILSGYRLMPTSWQVHFLPDAIIRQLTPTFGLVAVTWASKAYFARRLAAGDPFYAAPLILFACLVVAPAFMYQQDRQYQGQSPAETIIALYGALINNVIIAMMYLTRSIFLQQGMRRYAAFGLIVAIGLTTHFLQFQIFIIALLIIFITRHDRIVALGVIAAVVGAYGVGLNYIPEAMRINPNSGIRLAFMSDALTSVIDTYGLGIGYGTEAVRWRYEFPGMPPFTFLPDANTMTHDRLLAALSTGVENSFMQAMLRNGVLGFLLLIAAHVVCIPSRRLPRPLRNHATLVFLTSVIGCFVNSTIESPLAVVGVGFCFGYLLALKKVAASLSAPMGPKGALFNDLLRGSA